MPTKIYLLRVAYSLMAIAQLLMERSVCGNPIAISDGLIVTLAIYPHIGHLVLGRFAARRLGQILFLVDGLIVGAVVSALGLLLFPSAVLTATNLFNWIIIGGPRLVAAGALAFLVGLLGYAESIDQLMPGTLSSCFESHIFSSIALMAYLSLIGSIIFVRIGEMRHLQERLQMTRDVAENARRVADQALLSAMPRQAAIAASNQRFDSTISLNEALVARIDFTPMDQSLTQRLLHLPQAWIDVVRVAERVLARHQIEIIKTMGLTVIVLSEDRNSVDNLILALEEIVNHLSNHTITTDPMSDDFTTQGIGVRAAADVGNVELRFVQPDRLNVELFGETMTRVNQIAIIFSTLHPKGLALTESASARSTLDLRPRIMEESRLLRNVLLYSLT